MGENNMSINLINYALAKKDWKKAYEDLKVLEIGGRNLILNSDKEYSSTGTVLSADILGSHRPLVEGETYTLSFDLKADEYTTSNRIFLNRSIIVYKTFEFPTEWKRQYVTFVYKADDFQGRQIFPHFYPSGDMRKYVRRFKLEKGNKATDWTPAPEDIDAHPFVAELAETVFRSKQQDWEKAYEDFKVLGVGGRNLIRNSDFSNGRDYWEGQFSLTEEGALLQSTVGAFHLIQSTIEIPEGEYVAQIRYKVIEGQAPYLFATNGTDMTILEGSIYFDVADNDWNTHTVRVRVRSKSRFFAIRYAVSSPADHVEGKTIISWVKLEKGNKATDWTPAPEDINAHPFVAELAETVYRSKQNEERIRNLENAITALGGGS